MPSRTSRLRAPRSNIFDAAPELGLYHCSLGEEGHLPADICRPGYDPSTYDRPMARVLLTGATGYLGAYLLKELMTQTDARILCLVRASTQGEGRGRIVTNLRRYALWDPAYEGRLEVVLGEYGDTADVEDAFRELDEAGGALDHGCAPPPPLGVVSRAEGAATRPPAEVAAALLTHLVAGDAKAAGALVHPDAQLFHPGDPERLPWAGRWAGRDIQDLVQRRKDGIEVLEHRVDRVLPVGATHGVIQAWERARIRATGRSFESRYAGPAQVSGDRCESLWIYADTGALHRAFAPPQWLQS